MKKVGIVVMTLFLFTCNSDDDDANKARILTRIEALSYSGFVENTFYEHDQQGRIIKKRKQRDDGDFSESFTATYSGNEITLTYEPYHDPLFTQSTHVVLTIDERGKPEKRIEYTLKESNDGSVVPTRQFIYDTLYYEYDAAGFLARTMGKRYDSTWIGDNHHRVMRSASTATYTMESGNLVSIEDVTDWPIVTQNGNTTVHGGGSSQNKIVFKYGQSYPNKTDFRNAVVLNQFRRDYEPILNENYANMPDQAIITYKNKDINGDVTFVLENSVINMERVYNSEGMLSSLRIPGGTQFIETNYFYQ